MYYLACVRRISQEDFAPLITLDLLSFLAVCSIAKTFYDTIWIVYELN